jgi:hypothetical protein
LGACHGSDEHLLIPYLVVKGSKIGGAWAMGIFIQVFVSINQHKKLKGAGHEKTYEFDLDDTLGGDLLLGRVCLPSWQHGSGAA